MKKTAPAQKEPAKQELARKAPAKKAPAKKAPAKKARPAADDRPRMARKYSKDRAVCRVTFWLPKDAAPDATSVAVAGSFNDWSLGRHPMKQVKGGDFQLALELESGREFEFRFVIDGVRWESAWNADKYVWNEHAHCENSVIVT